MPFGVLSSLISPATPGQIILIKASTATTAKKPFIYVFFFIVANFRAKLIKNIVIITLY